jgi:hypothetical protein
LVSFTKNKPQYAKNNTWHCYRGYVLCVVLSKKRKFMRLAADVAKGTLVGVAEKEKRIKKRLSCMFRDSYQIRIVLL